MTQATEFNAIRISLASPEQIKQWSYGEVTKPETINYRTLRPEKDGLFDERIFGPTKDWECYCGKYKKIRYKGVICDRCGVEVTRAKVRRERMGHIGLAAPVAHIWFAKGIPSRLGLLLDVSPRNLERVLYFAQYIVRVVDPLARQRVIDSLQATVQEQTVALDLETESQVNDIRAAFEADGNKEDEAAVQQMEVSCNELLSKTEEAKSKLTGDMQAKIDDVESLRPLQLLTESRYRELHDQFGDAFKAGMGAEAILEILRSLDLETVSVDLERELRTTSGQRRKKAIKRVRVVESFRRSSNKPEWMVLTALPVLPPDLRPMVQLDGGRFATSDLNDLYRRVINRNNRLRRLLELGAPDIIVRNEKRMLQEAVDDLIDNGRRGRALVGSHNHKLKSLSDLLRGKQGRFRQNLLGKRVDYGGRSVIVVGPTLKLHQCGLPKKMALELFKPFVMNRLVLQGLAHNIKSAKRMVERTRPEVWDILEEVIEGRPVLLNRAPTLHRLGIQAFMPVLVEGNAIKIHPLVCTAFNADFDGDQMAVHVPLSTEAVMEARNVMLSTYNMLSPASGEPLVAPTLDMVLGCYYLTMNKAKVKGEGERFRDFEDLLMKMNAELVDLHATVQVRDPDHDGELITTTPGRVVFNAALPAAVRDYSRVIDKKALKELVSEAYRIVGNEETAEILDRIKTLGFHYATVSGITIGMNDLIVPHEKDALVAEASHKVEELEEQFEMGLITDRERYSQAVNIWQGVSNQMDTVIAKHLPEYGGVYIMAHSGAKGNEAQIKQMAGMRGLMSNPRGEIIDLPIKSSFREGLSVLEYFISTHGARKGLADTALRTADSGYLTRRLIDVSQEIIINDHDCGTDLGTLVYANASEEDVMIDSISERIIGRTAAATIADPRTGEVLVDKNETIEKVAAQTIEKAGIKEVYVRSPQNCMTKRGICRLCYGTSPATGQPPLSGEAVGIIAAQSIGEPGTQLTMRTFHTGGVAGKDITSGLPRVEELFESRSPKGKSVLAEIDGVTMVFESGKLVGEYKGEDDQHGTVLVPPAVVNPVIRVVNRTPYLDPYPLAEGYTPSVKNGTLVEVGDSLARPTKASSKPATTESGESLPQRTDILARSPGKVKVTKGYIEIASEEVEIRDHHVAATDSRLVYTGDKVHSGQKLTIGVKDPHDILRIEGTEPTQRYLQEQVQTVYRSQGVTINDKHIEVIVRQMLRWVRVENTGDTNLLPNQLIDRLQFQDVNASVIAEGKEPATSKPEILGVTRASLNTDSFLAKASFQETARVLTEAAILGEVDYLRGLKENVIIGRLIPARLDISAEGRKRLGMPENAPASIGAHMGAGNGAISAEVLADYSDEPSSLLAELEEDLLGNGGVALSEAFSEEIADALDAPEGEVSGDDEPDVDDAEVDAEVKE